MTTGSITMDEQEEELMCPNPGKMDMGWIEKEAKPRLEN